jgi:methylthioribose-1-phosphate isomerase
VKNELFKTLTWENELLALIDQRKLPLEEEYVHCKTLEETHGAIKDMVVRGAPLIGFTALYGMVLYFKNNPKTTLDELRKACDYLKTARPTAVNLEYEVDRTYDLAKMYLAKQGSLENFSALLIDLAESQTEELRQKNLTMAKLAEAELDRTIGKKTYRILTLCNTGYLACGPLGTALGVVSYMHSKSRIEHVYASETRPYLQGSRLTAFELLKQEIDHSIIVEGAHSYLLRKGLVDAIFIGADRIVRNGDTANKIGSSSLAIIAKHYGVPFYVVAPLSSFDLNAKTGDEISIELRPEEEVLSAQGARIAPIGSHAWNPSFDITENTLITGTYCEKGLISPVNEESLMKVAKL